MTVQTTRTGKRQWWVQDAIEDTESNVFAATAGLGSGKTHGLCEWHHSRVVLNPDSPFSAVMMPIYQKIHDAAIPTYKKVIDSLGYVENVDYHVLKTPYPKLIYANGHEVHFISGSRPDKIVAVEYSHGSCSEGATTPGDAYKLLRSRIRCNRATVRQTFVEGVGEGGGWYQDTFDSDVLQGWLATKWARAWQFVKQTRAGKEIRYKRYRIRTKDNPYLPDDYIENLFDLFGFNQNYIDVYINGFFRELVSGQAYSEYRAALHDCDVDPEPQRDLYMSWDFNANPLAWVTAQKRHYYDYADKKEMLVVCDNAELSSSSLDDACAEFAVKHPVDRWRNTNIRIYGDSSGHAQSHKTKYTDYQKIKKVLKKFGYLNIQTEAFRSNPREVDSVDAVNDMFLASYLFINRRCKVLRKSLLSTKWKEGTRKLDKPPGETHTHPGDALKYLCYALFENSNVKRRRTFNA